MSRPSAWHHCLPVSSLCGLSCLCSLVVPFPPAVAVHSQGSPMKQLLSLCCIAAVRGNSSVTKSPGFAHCPSRVVAEKPWGFCWLSHASPHSPVKSHHTFPFSVLCFAQPGYKRREDTHAPACSFCRGEKTT